MSITDWGLLPFSRGFYPMSGSPGELFDLHANTGRLTLDQAQNAGAA
jgi:hypothetical protein